MKFDYEVRPYYKPLIFSDWLRQPTVLRLVEVAHCFEIG